MLSHLDGLRTPNKNEQEHAGGGGGHTPFVQALEERNSSRFFVHSLLDHLGVLEIPAWGKTWYGSSVHWDES